VTFPARAQHPRRHAQLAKALGAEVTGVCSTGKADLVRSIGADHVIDYTHDDFADGHQHYDLILDTGGTAASPGCAGHSPPPGPWSSPAAKAASGPESAGNSGHWRSPRSPASG